MAACGDSAYEMVSVFGIGDIKKNVVAEAQISSINRANNTADLVYVSTCNPALPSTDVEFFYHCETSTGTIEDLANGHSAFVDGDTVYVVHLPAIGGQAARTYIVGHVDIRSTKKCKQWMAIRLNARGRGYTDAFVAIIDITSGELYDKWDDVSFPVRWNDTAFLARASLVTPVTPDVIDEAIAGENRDYWYNGNFDQFKAGLPWTNGRITTTTQGSITTIDNTSETNQPGIFERINPDSSQCYLHHSSWTIDSTETNVTLPSIEYELEVGPLPYDYEGDLTSLGSVGGYNKNTRNTLSSEKDGEMYVWNLANGHTYFLNPNTENNVTSDSSYINPYYAQSVTTGGANWPSVSFACYVLKDNTSQIYEFSVSVDASYHYEGTLTGNGDYEYSFCEGSAETLSGHRSGTRTFNYSMKAPWGASAFSAATITATQETDVTTISGWNFSNISAIGNPALLSYVDDYNQNPLFYTSRLDGPIDVPVIPQNPLKIATSCMANSSFGVFGISVVARYENDAYAITANTMADYTGANTEIDLSKIVVDVALGFANHSPSLSLGSINSITVPSGLMNTIKTMIQMHDQSASEQLTPEGVASVMGESLLFDMLPVIISEE